ncbi:hypothetical protein H696_03970 [Fonticula alba]|uniref:Uncharacterized protein n=1 Tax=Fonticula alba TaxID=691883 RepID=A0A058Z5K0_FONAL|nr:hypothetical protein H696_03970 [Fonticula alba]KCV69549.1 hypothetical protein H696_03970 [Fonticula alba]|eukprot:XP_009496114.1 hypothetical protein H696_03970 [Fonticula alba]
MPADDFAGLALLSPIPNGDGTYSSPNDVSEVYTFTDGKRAILSVCGAVLLFNIACFGWMVLKRSYLPFKAKQLPILGLMLLVAIRLSRAASPAPSAPCQTIQLTLAPTLTSACIHVWLLQPARSSLPVFLYATSQLPLWPSVPLRPCLLPFYQPFNHIPRRMEL